MSASERQKQSTRRTALAGLIGNVMEWFDFAVYGYFASVIGAQFFPQSSPHAQLLLTFAVFAIGFLSRPIGGLLLGRVKMPGFAFPRVVTVRDGRVIEQALMREGESRSFAAADVGSVKLGNAAVVRVQQAGSIVDLAPYRRANVARFAVSSDGSVAPAE